MYNVYQAIKRASGSELRRKGVSFTSSSVHTICLKRHVNAHSIADKWLIALIEFLSDVLLG